MKSDRTAIDIDTLVNLGWYRETEAIEIWRKEIKPLKKYVEKDRRLYEIIKERREKLELPPI